ncbi:farnesyl pyrophosphate synthase-like [Artemia franciscana]|uniref:Farnesyl pyrophosphate synthase n=1 Tax=Artemia franciscana TaxID=6661 RepID=A0AA88L568_ARTSF|nr:hypothetical protein QYM36_011783 [Artemia franciscana]
MLPSRKLFNDLFKFSIKPVLHFEGLVVTKAVSVRHGNTSQKYQRRADLEAVLPRIINEAIVENPILEGLPVVQDWYKKVFEYNLVGGKMTRGLLFLDSFHKMADPSMINKRTVFEAQAMAWTIELLLSAILLIDDMMDEAYTRRGHDCWYRTNNLGPKATNDGLFMEAAIFEFLKKYFYDKPYYMNVVRVFEEVLHKTNLGQVIDMHAYTTDGKTDLSKVTKEQVSLIAIYKTSYLTTYIPVVLAMHMVGLGDPRFIEAVKNILLETGVYFQAQDDFIDCFGNESITGKYGTDIEDGKCTWLLATALEKGTPEQIEVLKKNYGIKDKECRAIVKQLYNDIGMVEEFKKYEKEIQERLRREIELLPTEIPKGPFVTILDRLRGRNH